MKSLPSSLLKSLPALLLGLGSCVGLTQCASTDSLASLASPADLGTPSHRLPRSEYPFDSKGNYREDWVEPAPPKPRPVSSSS